MVPDRNIFHRIWAHETCRIRGHDWRNYQKVHHTQIEEGMWSALVDEKGKQCARCGMTSEVRVLRR